MMFAISYPRAIVTPGMNRASVRATWSKVLWSSLRTITLHESPMPVPGPPVRGSSMVSLIGHQDKAPRRPIQ